jgi:hypothetical protein
LDTEDYTQVCSKCAKPKTSNQFKPPNEQCNDCIKEYKRLWFQQNKAKIRAKARERQAQETNAERQARLEYARRYYAENKERLESRNKAYYLANREQINSARRKDPALIKPREKKPAEELKARKRELDKLHRQKYPERYKEISRRYRESSKGKRVQYHRAWYKENQERLARIGSKWRTSNRHKINVNEQRRRAHEYANGKNDFTVSQWQEILEAFNRCCAYCNQPYVRLEIEHMVPLVRQGQHTASNIVPACRSCNAKKGTKTLLEFLMVYGTNPALS